MCQLASFIHDPKHAKVRVYNLMSHTATYSHFRPSRIWFAGDYLPAGTIVCHTPAGRSASMENTIKARWPSFTDFFAWAIKNGADLSQGNGCSTIDALKQAGKTFNLKECLAIANGKKVAAKARKPALPKMINGRPAIVDAAMNGYAAGVKACIVANHDVNAVTSGYNRTALTKMLDAGIAEATALPIADMLVKAGIDVNVADGYGKTALYYAAKADQPNMVLLLIEAGADPMSQSQRGLRAIDKTTPGSLCNMLLRAASAVRK